MSAVPFPYRGITEAAPHLGGYVAAQEHTGTWAPNVLYELYRKIKPRTVTDIGCGVGHVGQWFFERGCSVLGIDGADVPGRDWPIVRHDYERQGAFRIDGRDLAVSFEFIEHVEASCEEHWLASVDGHRWLALSHATPGQAGHHHVNCQLPSYWIRRLGERGWRLDAPFSLDMRALINRADDAGRCIKNSFLLFERVDIP